MTSPNGAVPDQAYVSGGSGQSGLSDLNDLTEGVAKSRMRAPLANSFGNQVNGFWGAVSGLVGAVVGGVTAVVNGIVGVINSIAGLFTTTRVDMGKVDKARADAENAMVANMSSSLEMLDEIQRFGGAYCSSPSFYRTTYGELVAEPVPLNTAYPLAAGTSFIPPAYPSARPSEGQTLPNSETARANLARASGLLVLEESGLWLIFFRVGVLQGNQYTDRPSDAWCYVTQNEGTSGPYLPVGSPGFSDDGSVHPYGAGYIDVRRASDGSKSFINTSVMKAYGRATSYVGIQNAQTGGGVGLFGSFPVYLETGGWKVSMAVQAYAKYMGASTTNVFAYKVNSESLRDSIDDLKEAVELALPGATTALSLDEASIQAMVSEAQNVEVDIDYNGE